MKHLFLTFISFIFFDSFSQDVPSDSILLRKIFGKTDAGGTTVSSIYSGDENIYSYQDSVVYRIIFKEKTTISNNEVILVVVEAPYGTQHGHQFGYQDVYFLKEINNKLEIIDSIKSDGIIPIGDDSACEIVDIGKDKKAIVFTFQSTGNHHLEHTQSIHLIELNKLTYLVSIDSEYDNSPWVTTEKKHDACQAQHYEEVYEIIKSNSEWYNIKVYHKDYGFTKGCKESFIKSESVKEYIYFEGKYIEKK